MINQDIVITIAEPRAMSHIGWLLRLCGVSSVLGTRSFTRRWALQANGACQMIKRTCKGTKNSVLPALCRPPTISKSKSAARLYGCVVWGEEL